MLDELDLVQGAVIRQIVVGSSSAVSVSPFNRSGRVNAFVIDARVGLYVKHSTKRLSPWTFTFHRDNWQELTDVQAAHNDTFIALVCGKDGVATIDMGILSDLVTFESTDQAWLRVERTPRSMYSVSGNRNELARKISRGVAPVSLALQQARNQRL
jgi:hypothetical protein